ncbi:MAG: hypothetical protein GVY08_15890 [Bacteroidetes bacterium]|nr:hypothetical protein [Bacteroidota bacterium]
MRPTVHLLLIWFVMSCAGTQNRTGDEPGGPISLQEAARMEDDSVASLLDGYRERYEEEMGVEVAEVEYPLTFGAPESRMGNLVADAIRARAARETRSFVHLSLIGEGSFKLNFNEGPLTLGEVLEFMPYENHLVLLKIDGEMVIELSQQIAERGGVPVSGLRLRIEDNKARQVLVNSQIPEKDKEYWLATSSWIANGGGKFTALDEPLERVDYDLSIRQLYIDYFKNRRTVAPELDGRIRQ